MIIFLNTDINHATLHLKTIQGLLIMWDPVWTSTQAVLSSQKTPQSWCWAFKWLQILSLPDAIPLWPDFFD